MDQNYEYNPPYSKYTYSREFERIIIQHGTKLDLPAGKTIIAPYEDTHFYYFKEGRVRLSLMSEEGAEVIIAIIDSPGFEGAAQMLSGYEDITYITTEVPTIAYRLTRETFLSLFHSSRVFREIIVVDISKIVMRCSRLIASHSFQPCEQRLIELLKASVDMDQTTKDGWYPLTHQYSQLDMGKIIGATRVTINKCIGRFRDEGFIRIINGKIQVKPDCY